MTLLNPTFLFALFALAVPIAIHLFNFHRYRNVYFSNVRYLQELQQATQRQRHLRQWLVLAMRCLAIAFLVLAFCQPVRVQPRQTIARGGSAVSIYIDNSFSMENVGSEGTQLHLAVQKAKEISAAYKEDDRFQLLTADMQGSEFRWLSREELQARLDALAISPASPRLSTVMKRQVDFLRDAPAGERNAYVISDFQQAAVDADELPADSLVHVTLLPLPVQQVNNIYLDSVSLNAPVFYEGSTVVATAFLHNAGDSKAERVPLRLFVDDRQRALADVDIEAHGRAAVPLKFTIDRMGLLAGRVEITDYPIHFDDTLFFALNVQKHIDITIINGRGENIYLQRLFEGDSTVRLHSASAQTIDFSALSQSRFVLLNELNELPGGLVQTLQAFVGDGGTLLIVPAEDADVASYNAALKLFSAPQLQPWKQAKSNAVAVNTTHPLYRNVFEGTVQGMELPTLQGSFGLAGDAGTVKESLITLNNGNDYLAVTPYGEGRVFLFSAPLQATATDFVQQALFVPTLYNMALYSSSVGVPYSILGSGVAIPLQQRYEADRVVHLTRLQGGIDLIPDLRRKAGKSYLIPHADMNLAGHYRLGDETAAQECLAFNYSRGESAMQFLDAAALQQLIADNHLQGYDVVRNAHRSLTAAIQAEREGQPLWRWCLILALAALLAEILLLRLPLRQADK